MKCVLCKTGNTKPGKAALYFERDGEPHVVRQVPAEICSNCGEEYFSSDVVQLLEGELDEHTVLDVPTETRSFVMNPEFRAGA